MDTPLPFGCYIFSVNPIPAKKICERILHGKHMPNFQIVLSTANSQEQAEQIARHLVEHHLAACVNLVPAIQSIYRWQDKIESEREVLMLIKTDAAHSQEVEAAIIALHSYEVPEVLVLPLTGGSEPYLAWLASSLESAG
jgi:periplasmic divalent cation tolerance protein